MNVKLKSALMIGGMVLSWSVYYTVSKLLVDATGSAALSGMLLRLAALVFLTVQLYEDHTFGALIRQGKKQLIACCNITKNIQAALRTSRAAFFICAPAQRDIRRFTPRSFASQRPARNIPATGSGRRTSSAFHKTRRIAR